MRYQYNPETGIFCYISITGNAHMLFPKRKGKRAIIYHGGKRLLANRLAWELMTGSPPKGRVFFADGNVLNLKWSNLTDKKPAKK